MADDPQLLIVGTGARRGRPKVAEPRTSVSTWLPASAHDRLIQLAREQDVSVSSLVKSWLLLQLNAPRR